MLVREALPSDYAAMGRLFEEVDAIHATAEPDVFQMPATPGRSPRFLDSKLEALDAGVFVAEIDAPARGPGSEQAATAPRTLVGFAIVRLSAAPDVPVLKARRFAYLEDIVVSSSYLRTGVGRALMHRVEEWTRAQDVRR